MPPPPEPLAVVFALRMEARPFRHALGRRRGAGSPVEPAWGSCGATDVVWAVTGIGEQRARDGAEALIARTAPYALLITGFCGGLAHGMANGDLVCATGCLGMGRNGALRPARPLLEAALGALHGGAHTVHDGLLLTVDRPLQTPCAKAEKRREWPGAIAVDMETYGAAEAAEAAGVPWLAIRCVTDGPDDRLPPGLDRITADGHPDAAAIAVAAALRPRSLLRLAATARAASMAALTLGDAVRLVVAATAGLRRPLRRSGCE